MATEPKARVRQRGPVPRFEQRVLFGSLLVAVPALMTVTGLLVFGPPQGYGLLVLLLVLAVLTGWLARWQFRRVVYPIYALSGLIEALREGDYSLRGTAGSVLGDLVHDLNDTADRLQAERLNHEESSYLLSKTLAALDSAVFVFDGRGRLRLMNPAALTLLDEERNHLFGLSAEELGLAGMLDAPPTHVLTHAFPGRTGRFEVRHAPLRRGGRGGRLLVINDLGRVLREEERQAWQRLLRVLGHEVNNSLAPIRSMADTLSTLVAREPLPEDWREDFRGGMEVIGKRAEGLARFLSGYSRLARLPNPERREIDLAGLVCKVALLETRMPVRIDSEAALTVPADPDQIEQALINLIRNAVEAAAEGGSAVHVRWQSDAQWAVIEVHDDGPGPPRSDNLFVPFFTTKPGGSGIGLALVRQIAEAHEGGVTLEPREGGGAVARLWLPRVGIDGDSPSEPV